MGKPGRPKGRGLSNIGRVTLKCRRRRARDAWILANHTPEELQEMKRKVRERRGLPPDPVPKDTFMTDSTNREEVLMLAPYVPDEAIEVMDRDYREFVCRRREFMSEEDYDDMQRVINVVRTAQVLFFFSSFSLSS